MSELEKPWRKGLGAIEKPHRPMRPDTKLKERLMPCEQLVDAPIYEVRLYLQGRNPLNIRPHDGSSHQYRRLRAIGPLSG